MLVQGLIQFRKILAIAVSPLSHLLRLHVAWKGFVTGDSISKQVDHSLWPRDDVYQGMPLTDLSSCVICHALSYCSTLFAQDLASIIVSKLNCYTPMIQIKSRLLGN